MHLLKILVCSLGTTLGAAAPSLQRRDSFPIPYIGESLSDYTDQLLSFLSNAVIGPVDNLRTIATILPRPSLSWNIDFLKAISKTDDLPNLNAPCRRCRRVEGQVVYRSRRPHQGRPRYPLLTRQRVRAWYVPYVSRLVAGCMERVQYQK